MTAISSAELTQMRSDVEQLMPDKCNILSVVRASDGMGGFTETWGTVTANARCRLDKVRGVEKVTGGALSPYSRWMLTLPYDATVTAANRIEHGGNTYAVVDPSDEDKSWRVSVRCEVEKV